MTVTTNDISITYGDAIPELTIASIDGFVGGDTELPTPIALRTSANSGSPSGEYEITLATGEGINGNYVVTLQPANVTIAPTGEPNDIVVTLSANSGKVGETITVSATGGTGGGVYLFESSNTDVAVISGIFQYNRTELTLVGAGETQIRARKLPFEGYGGSDWSEPVTLTVSGSILIGDVNGDGKITTADAVLLLQHIAKLITLEGQELASADVNQDGNITTADAVLLLQYIAKLIPSLSTKSLP